MAGERLVTRVVGAVFDLDGTLLDTMSAAPLAYVATIAELGGPAVDPAEVVAAWHLGNTRAVLAHFLGGSVTEADLDRYHRHAALVSAAAQPFPGVPAMLRGLRNAGHPLAVYTGASRRVAEPLLAATELAGYFSVLVCGDQVREPKPAGEGLVTACRVLGLPSAAAVYVGDQPADLACAAAAGARGIHAGWGGTNGVAGPDATAVTPADVLRLMAAGTADR